MNNGLQKDGERRWLFTLKGLAYISKLRSKAVCHPHRRPPVSVPESFFIGILNSRIADAPLFNGITSQELAVLLQNDGRQTPLFFQQEFLDDTMSPWNTSDIDWSSVYQDIAAAAPGLRALIAQMEHDVHGDTIQDIVGAYDGATPCHVLSFLTQRHPRFKAAPLWKVRGA